MLRAVLVVFAAVPRLHDAFTAAVVAPPNGFMAIVRSQARQRTPAAHVATLANRVP